MSVVDARRMNVVHEHRVTVEKPVMTVENSVKRNEASTPVRTPVAIDATHRRDPRREGGVALLIAMLMLIIFGAMAVASMDTVTRDRQIAGIHSQAHLAFQAAEAGIAAGLAGLRNPTQKWPTSIAGLANFNPALPNVVLGDSYDHPHGLPTYVQDPDAPQPIQYLGVGGECPEWEVSLDTSNIGGGGLTVLETVFDIRVQGQTQTGARTRIEAAAARCHVFEQG